MNRRSSLKYAAGISAMVSVGLTPWKPWKVVKRAIPSSGELLPIVGLGTWQTFDVGESDQARIPLKGVLRALIEFGGTVVDSSPMYGRSEQVVGDLSRELGLTGNIFGATKVWTQGESGGISQMKKSSQKMAQSPMDLMQVHNLVDWKTHLNTLFKWKEQGKVRYVGITHYQNSAYARMAEIIKNYPIDFVQVNYSLISRTSGEVVLPLAKDLGKAVIINRPYEGGSLFRQVQGKPLPSWAKDIDCSSWAEFFLKFILSNTAVTCAIPGTSKEAHIKENLGASQGRLPNSNQQKKMVDYLNRL
jgi:diketogulonate reductase-like aldo/keto reductase